jgi:hypothetical protein
MSCPNALNVFSVVLEAVAQEQPTEILNCSFCDGDRFNGLIAYVFERRGGNDASPRIAFGRAVSSQPDEYSVRCFDQFGKTVRHCVPELFLRQQIIDNPSNGNGMRTEYAVQLKHGAHARSALVYAMREGCGERLVYRPLHGASLDQVSEHELDLRKRTHHPTPKLGEGMGRLNGSTAGIFAGLAGRKHWNCRSGHPANIRRSWMTARTGHQARCRCGVVEHALTYAVHGHSRED